MITSAELALVEEALSRAVASDVDLLSEAGRYIIGAGGKRLRPRLVLLSYKAVGGEDVAQAVPAAATVELLHTASLIHDDINDHSDIRRGKASVNAQWGNGLALLIGDFVFVRLLRLMSGFGPRAIQVLADCCGDIVEGETLQMLHQRDLGMSEETYLKIVSRKTASLFAASTELGGALVPGPETQVEALKSYGLNLGMAFQIRDDTLDVTGKTDKLGKPVASDLEQGKMSLATIAALGRVEDADEVLYSGDLGRAVQLLKDTGALDYAEAKAREYAERAKEALAVLPSSVARTSLSTLADVAVTRER